MRLNGKQTRYGAILCRIGEICAPGTRTTRNPKRTKAPRFAGFVLLEVRRGALVSPTETHAKTAPMLPKRQRATATATAATTTDATDPNPKPNPNPNENHKPKPTRTATTAHHAKTAPGFFLPGYSFFCSRAQRSHYSAARAALPFPRRAHSQKSPLRFLFRVARSPVFLLRALFFPFLRGRLTNMPL